MRSTLSKIAIRKAVGLYLGDQEVAICKVASTPLGPVEIASSCERCTADDLPGVMERLLASYLGRKRRAPFAVGLPASRLFFGTRLIAANATSSAESVMQKALCSSNISVEDLTVDLLRSEVNKMPVASVVACRRKYISGVVGQLGKHNLRPFRTEPAPCALVRLAGQQHRPPRRARALLRVFLNSTHGLAVMVIGEVPLAWRSFVLPEGMEGFAILSAARTLRTQHQHYGIESSLDYVMIHGRADLHARLQEEQFASEMGTRVQWYDGPTLEASAIALGLAMGCLTQDRQAFDLSRSLKSRAPIKEIIPWGELCFVAALIAGMAVVMSMHANELHTASMKLRSQNSKHACLASGDPRRLEKDKQEMQKKRDTVREFLETRLQWTDYLRDISERLPQNAVLSSLVGRNPLGSGDKEKKVDGSFDLRGSAPLDEKGAIPRDVNAFLKAIQRDQVWKSDFDRIATDIKLPLGGRSANTGIDFSVDCHRGKPAKGGKKAAPDKKAH